MNNLASKSSYLTKLRTLCCVLATITGRKRSAVKEFLTALDFYFTEESPFKENLEEEFENAVTELLLFHLQGVDKQFKPIHWNLKDELFEPLWIRASLLEKLKSIAGYDHAVLIITNLDKSVCPNGKRWTENKKNSYEESLEFIQSCCQSWTTQNSNVNIIVL